MEQKRCISSFTLAELTAELKAMGQPGFRAKQIFHWVHQKLVTEFSAMTDQPKTLLAKLEESFYIAAPKIERRQEAKDGTVKYLLRMADGNCIETVVMRYHYGNTVCVSTQVGCRMGCRFCASTQAGRVRDLEAGEICSEIYTAQKDIGERISHIVLMGIGEPLDNFDEVMKFLENITSPEGVNIGMRNISLSTCGLVPKIDQLAEKKLQLTLSVSLHAPNNEIRSGMMPVNDAYPVEVLMQAVRRYQDTTGRRVSFEYSMVRGVNDSDACARQLANLIRGKGMVKILPILIGVLVSYAVALVTGAVDFQRISEAAWVGIPLHKEAMGLFAIDGSPEFISALFTIIPIALATMMEHVGDIAAISATVGHNYINDPGLNRTLLGDGLATTMAGLLGGPANTTYGENTGVLALSKIYDPLVIRIAAVLAIILSFSPKFEAVINTIPTGIIGGISFVLYGMISAIGVRNVVENRVDFTNSRNLIVAAVILVCALGFNSVGGVGFTVGSVTINLSGLAVAAIAGILLNAILPGNDYEFDATAGSDAATSGNLQV